MSEDNTPASPVTEPDSGVAVNGGAGTETKAGRRHGGGLAAGFAGGLIGGALVGVAAAGAVLIFAPSLKNILLAPELMRIDALETDVHDHGKRLAAVETATTRRPAPAPMAALAAPPSGEAAPPADVTAPLTALSQRIGDAETKLARLEGDLDQVRKAMPPEGVILRLADRAEQAEKAVRAVARQRQSAEALLLAIGQLKDAIDRGDPYGTELRTVRRLLPSEDAARLDPLGTDADSGLTTRRVLIDSFPAMADAAARAERNPVGDDWASRVWRKAATLVSIRRVDGQGNATDAVLSRAEARLKVGDLGGAASELAALQGDAATAAAAWRGKAGARVAAERTLSALVATAAGDAANGG